MSTNSQGTELVLIKPALDTPALSDRDVQIDEPLIRPDAGVAAGMELTQHPVSAAFPGRSGQGGGLKQHPLSTAFPSMSEGEIEELADDIKTNGQREPGVLLDGEILDGWHRYRACQMAGVEFKADELPPHEDPFKFVLSRNVHRRHLTAS